MTSPLGRIYATAITLFAFFLPGRSIASNPWPSKTPPRPTPGCA